MTMKRNAGNQNQDANQDRNAPGADRDGNFQHRPGDAANPDDANRESDGDIDVDDEEFEDEDEDAELEEGDKGVE
jgi:hypothetical protein